MIRVALALFAACLAAPGSTAVPSAVRVVVVPSAKVRIDTVRIEHEQGRLAVHARVRWLVVPVTHSKDHVRIEALANGRCVRATVQSWNHRRHHQRRSSQPLHATLVVGDEPIDEVRISRHADDPDAHMCGS